MRIGFGYDVHRLAEGRPLILGGISIPSAKGLEGHSDADVLIHALIDALLGAASLGDIGTHFPDDDPYLKGADSRELLKKVMVMIRGKGLDIGNVDTTICMQQPRLSHYMAPIRESLSSILDASLDQVSVKATTTEHLGFVGRGEGASAFAVVLLNELKG